MTRPRRVVQVKGGEVVVRALNMIDAMVLQASATPFDDLFKRALPNGFDIDTLSDADAASVAVAVLELNRDLPTRIGSPEVAERFAAFRGGEPAGNGSGSPGGGPGGNGDVAPEVVSEQAAPAGADAGLGI